ncbi:hypothetical protein CNY89_08050, partial [Amaricoccus sp. HAR-UPW-R2A-40]
MIFDFAHDADGVTLRLRTPKTKALFGFLTPRPAPRDLDRLGPEDRALALAIADLRSLADDHPGELEIAGDTIRMSHRIAAGLDGEAAATLGLPPLVDLILRTDVEGVLGAPSFRLHHEWVRDGRRQSVRREGAFLRTSGGLRRLPLWLLGAVEVAEGFSSDRNDAAHWEALARFRQALDPGVGIGEETQAGRVSMSDFLAGLEVRLADCFAITPNGAADDFEVVPFSGSRLEGLTDEVGETHGELRGSELHTFQQRIRERGALPAYRLGRGSFLVVDRAAMPTLRMMADVQREPTAARKAFIANPRARITETIESSLRATGALEDLAPEAQEEAIEALAGPMFVETREFSERVLGIRVYEPPLMDFGQTSGTSWMPEIFSEQIARVLEGLPTEDLEALCDAVEAAMETGQESVTIGAEQIAASREALSALRSIMTARQTASPSDEETSGERTGASDPAKGPVIVDAATNFEGQVWRPRISQRAATRTPAPLSGIRTRLKPHQISSLTWQIDSWSAGAAGVLNADEQGLGKTLQTLAFLVWLKTRLAEERRGGPILVVAPTSLLKNWEQEADRHLEAPGLGYLLRLYGSGLGAVRRPGQNAETKHGDETLDFARLRDDIAEGQGHRTWILTTYTTLVNYQHSLARLPLSAVVFDEIQALKNP